MDGVTDRQLLDREIAAYTTAGWQIVSQSESGFQIAQPKKLNPIGMALFVMLPALVGCLAFFVSAIYGIGILVLAGVGLLIVLADYAVKKPELRYITVDQIRAAMSAGFKQ